MANNTWLTISLKLTDKPNSFFAGKLFESPTRAGDLASGTLLGGSIPARPARRMVEPIIQILRSIASGVFHGGIYVHANDGTGTFSSGVVACVQANAATDTVVFTYGGLAITFTEGATGAQGFARGASNTTCAAALAAAINAHPVMKTLVTAVASVGNVTMTSKLPGNVLTGIVMTTSDGTAFSFTQFTGGTIGVGSVFPQGFAANKNL